MPAVVLRYRVTVYISRDREEDWRQWMLGKHIPDVMATGYFTDWQMSEIIGNSNAAPEGKNGYVIEYAAASPEDYETYQRDCAPALQKEHTQRYAGDFEAMRVLLTDYAA